MNRRFLLRLSIPLAAVAIAVFMVMPLIGGASPDGETGPDLETSTQDYAPGYGALRAHLNPETGRVDVSTTGAVAMPLDADTREALRRDTEGLKEIYHANGAVSVKLEGRFQSVSVARINEDGKVSVCSDDADAVQGLLDNENTNVSSQTPEVK